jgi:hypothetical protein
MSPPLRLRYAAEYIGDIHTFEAGREAPTHMKILRANFSILAC